MQAVAKRLVINQPRHVIQTVGPIFAEEMLSRNEGNRTIREHRVHELARAMKEGRWRTWTNDLICVSPSGRLLNGQHRMMAIIESGCTVDMAFLFDCPETAYEVMDQGAARTTGDLLRHNGYTNANNCASLANMIAHYRAGDKIGKRDTHSIFSAEELLATYLENRESIDAAIIDSRKLKGIVEFRAAGVLSFYLRETGDHDWVTEFFDIAATGYRGSAPSSHPARVFNSLLINSIARKRSLSIVEVVAFGTKAYNAMIDGREVKLLTWRPEEPIQVPLKAAGPLGRGE